MSEPTRIVILGGGFGGLYTALRLNQLPWESAHKPLITLVDQSDRFLFSPLLYEWISGEVKTWEIAPPFAELLAGTDIQFLQQKIIGIDLDGKKVELADHNPLSYDKLVIALGGQTAPSRIPGVQDYALPFKTLSDAYRLGEKLRLLEASDSEKIRIAVVGGGYSGIEIATKLADRLGDRGRLRIIERGDSILKQSPEFNRKAAQKALEQRKIWLDLETEISEVEADTLSLGYKGQVDRIPVDIVLWTVGTQVSDLIRDLPLKHNAQGLISTNEFLQAIEHPNIYVIGDAADYQDVTGQKVPPTAQSAFQASDYCGWNLWADLSHRPSLPFRYLNLGEMITLGVDNATLSGLGLQFDGSLAYLARRLIYLYRQPTWQHRLNLGLKWATDPIVEWIG
jgi:NADH dehydrogenase